MVQTRHGWISNLLGGFGGRAHDGHALGQHDLVPYTRVQVPAAQETRLRRMRVDPAADHEFLAVDVVEEGVFAFVGRLACVGCADLVRDDEVADEEGA